MTREEWKELELTRKCLAQLRASLHLASLPADEQLEQLPERCDKPYELVADACHWIEWALQDANPLLLDRDQRQALEAYGSYAEGMSGAQNAPLWTEAAVRTNPDWEKLRWLAGISCRALENSIVDP